MRQRAMGRYGNGLSPAWLEASCPDSPTLLLSLFRCLAAAAVGTFTVLLLHCAYKCP